ncbi:CpaF family protein [Haloechinothrix halophila]|uniref:CpaF family protein n=1 Tax=Haloechinothrix halophila TaxID=1069073 RepID=UPI0004284898|nr:ATPase, T2SS/T4P/T4SS family [Haloechinothrix halophila]
MTRPWSDRAFAPTQPAGGNGAHRNGNSNGQNGSDAGMPDPRVVAEIRGAVAVRVERATRADEQAGTSLSATEERRRTEHYVAQEVADWVRRQAEAGVPPPSVEAEQALVRAVAASLAGLGALEELLERDDVENIHVHGHDRVFLELADGSMQRWPYPVADSDAVLVEMLAGIFARMGQTAREFSPAHPIGNLRLPAGGPLGSRLAALCEIVPWPTVAIRRHRLGGIRLADLVAMDTVDETLAELLSAAVRAGCNILVTGGPGAGKTTLLRVLCLEIPAGEHVITVEDEYELGLHLNTGLEPVTAMESRLANAEGVGEITLDDQLKQALRHSPKRVIVGEVRGGEITAMLRALGNGAAGGMCTLHARSADVVFDRIASLGMLAHPPLSVEAASAWTASAIDLIVHVVKIDDTDPHGRRRRRRYVSEVLSVGPVGDAGTPDTTRLYSRAAPGLPAKPVFTPGAELAARLAAHGFDAARLTTAGGEAGP